MKNKKRNYSKYFSIFLMLFVYTFQAQIGTAQIPEYYNDVNLSLTGTALKNELTTKITNTHTNALTYSEVWDALKITDLDPADGTQTNVILIYGYDDNDGNYVTDRTRSKNLNGGDAGTDWNREHTYAKSLGTPDLGTSGPGADAHHLRPSDVTFNGQRGSKKFATGSGNAGDSNGGWYPGDEWKGDVARMMMYMYTRYESRCLPTGVGIGSSASTPDDMIDLFLQWNVDDPVSQIEKNRNTYHGNTANTYAQGNRNPFIDNPAFATQIWGGPQAEDRFGTVYITLSSVTDFGMIPYGNVSTLQSYTVEGTELGTTLTIDAPTHFEISLTTTDGDFSKQIVLSTTAGELSSTTIYVRFKPESAVGTEIIDFIEHSSDTKTANLRVTGTEGDPALLPQDIYTQDFETDCATDWVKHSVTSNHNWTCDTYGHNGGVAIAMNNYEADEDSEDWLISPEFDITGYNDAELNYWMEWTYTGSTIELFYSTNYSGSGDPTVGGVTWIQIGSDLVWQDNWTEYNSDLSGIGASTFYLAYKHTSGYTSNNCSRINLDDITLSGIAENTVITTSKTTINFDYTESGSTSTTNYTVTGENLQANITVTTEAPFQVSLDGSTWFTTVDVLQADATDVVYARYNPTTEVLGEVTGTITHSTTGATNKIIDIVVAANPNIPTNASTLTYDKTLDLVTWNLEWFGAPEKSNHASTWSEQLSAVSAKIIELDADIYALQEVIVDTENGDFLTLLVNDLNTTTGAGTYTSLLGPRYSLDNQAPSTEWPAQRVCYIYKTANLSNVNSESMFSTLYPDPRPTTIAGYTGDASLFWASGRLPFLLEADVTIDGITVPFSFINIHAKCCSDSKDRKTADALFLKDELDDVNFDTKNVVVLGDYNDYYQGSMSSGDSPYITWWENTNEDYLRAVGASIDHISISNELYFEHQSLTNNYSVGTTTISDHDPVLLRLKLDEEGFLGHIVDLDEIEDKTNTDDPFIVTGHSSNDLTITYEIVSGPATLIGNVLSVTGVGTVVVRASNSGSATVLSASDEEQFDVTAAKQDQTLTFNLASSVNLSEGSVALSATASSGLSVSYSVTSGSGSISGSTLSFSQAGNITVRASQAGSDDYNPAQPVSKSITVNDDGSTSVIDVKKPTEFSVYPNPTNGIININNATTLKKAVLNIYSLTGNLIESHIINESLKLDISHLKSGSYIIKIDQKSNSKIIILK